MKSQANKAGQLFQKAFASHQAICGVNNHNQLEELVASVRPLPAEMRLMNFAINDPVILNPSNWQKCS